MKYLLFIITFIVPSVCFSSTDKYTEYLITTPVSIHDFAIYKTNIALKDFLFKIDSSYKYIVDGSKAGWVQMEYSLDKNIYVVNSSVYTDEKITKKTSLEFLKEINILIKRSFGVFQENNKIKIEIPGTSYFSGLLLHQGYSEASKPRNLGKEIDKKIVIKTRLTSDGKEYTCTGKLVSADISCAEKNSLY